ncbi:MAG: hypothetical protein COU29_01945 [Candidatus Magasanikbacteria bacterium CG10_big_fil_rev_8_21_14_0_10_36_32]|uniref:HTH cro/C1-type domain-containing protein n=1 Tax=Candidatus Magasanikbacteria bacterium CG10_big_fil_rev_8_21_14_0_10_36_32 TaxID=1974646 RepID=A0A2M6W6X0_9BACT|nr:MAG: hypothetical protein COU29_01945 [Candidatus Magasanikbacteria bacterium CG10_big_fil_rev_8_21_14_0_10_36_32]
MSTFSFKKLTSPIRLGSRFKTAREEWKLSFANVASATRIPLKYLELIENNTFNELPNAKAYRLGYIREYAEFLKLDPEQIINQFIQENGLKDISALHPNKVIGNTSFYSVSIWARNILAAVCVVLVFGYLTLQVKHILEPPRLVLLDPSEGLVTNQLNVVVRGETDTECQLTINGMETMLNEKGQFQSEIDLANGVNTLVVSATKKHGKTNTVTRHIIVKNTQFSKLIESFNTTN